MSLLREKLNRMKKPVAESSPKRPEPDLNEGWESIGAKLEVGEWGSFILRKKEYPSHHFHGNYPLSELYRACDHLGPMLNQPSPDPERILFFDTETTGLGIGAGNVPFMLGLGYYRANKFIVEQLLIRNPAEEVAMLAYFNRLLQQFDSLASYNGRTFDWPIIKSRFILNRLELNNDGVHQVDFLYPSRSLWRNTLPSCRLGKVEESRLGHVRTDDVPGSLAPTLYFQYLDEQDPAILQGVFLHNEQDILSLAGLAIHFARALEGDLDLSGMGAEELFRLGVWLEKHDKPDLAALAFERIPHLDPTDGADFRMELALLYKKKGRYKEAVELWKSLTGAALPNRALSAGCIEACVELSKYYEHKQKDFDTALHYAEEALTIAWGKASLLRSSSKQRALLDGLRKRVDRLKDKEMKQAMLELRAGSLG